MYTNIFSDSLPPVAAELMEAPEMRRLNGVGMHCGNEYTACDLYRGKAEYTRFGHSAGVARIVWNFTGDEIQAAAGLLHDISTPAFAHCVDFLNGDHARQESTEESTRVLIENSPDIRGILKRHGIPVNAVTDYHMYPVADNDSPMLSADRLEYTLGNAALIRGMSDKELKEIYGDLRVMKNERGETELGFQSPEIAARFAWAALVNSRWFASDLNRFAMQRLADILKAALDAGAISRVDLYGEEKPVIAKITAAPETARMWRAFTNLREVSSAKEKPEGVYCIKIPTKKRYINPLALSDGIPARIADLCPDIKAEIDDFLKDDFDRWVFTA